MLHKSFLENEYIVNKKSLKAIADQVGMTPSGVLYWMKKYNIPTRTSFDANIKDMVGKTFGFITVKELFNTEKHGAYWKCLCNCSCGGTVIIARGSSLRNNEYISCGAHKGWKGIYNLSGSYISSLKNGAKIRNLEWNITKEFLWDLFIKQNGKCSLSGMNITLEKKWSDKRFAKHQTASLDRIDSNAGYTEKNVQWVHKTVNKMKQNFNQDFFIKLCNLIVNKQLGDK